MLISPKHVLAATPRPASTKYLGTKFTHEINQALTQANPELNNLLMSSLEKNLFKLSAHF